jgi:hypothetical protein
MLQRWDEVEVDLRVEVTLALDEGRPPEPLLAAFAEERPVAVTRLRPFEAGDALQALIEVLALLLPLGADRLALALPGVAHLPARESSDVPDGEDGDDGDRGDRGDRGDPRVGDGQRLVLLATAEAVDDHVEVTGRLHPLERRDGRWLWVRDTVEVDARGVPLLDALAVLLEQRGALHRRDPLDGELQQQLARCLLLGHTVALSDEVADRLEPDRLADLLPPADGTGA